MAVVVTMIVLLFFRMFLIVNHTHFVINAENKWARA